MKSDEKPHIKVTVAEYHRLKAVEADHSSLLKELEGLQRVDVSVEGYAYFSDDGIYIHLRDVQQILSRHTTKND